MRFWWRRMLHGPSPAFMNGTGGRRTRLKWAIQLDPNYLFAHLWLANYHAARGNFDHDL